VVSLVVVVVNSGVRDGGEAYRMASVSSPSSSSSSFVCIPFISSVVWSDEYEEGSGGGRSFVNTDRSEKGLTNRVVGGEGG